MRKIVFALSALALAGLLQVPARAAPVTCSPVQGPAGAGWPYGKWTQTCGTALYGSDMPATMFLLGGKDAFDRLQNYVPTTGDQLRVIISDPDLAAPETVTYIVKATDKSMSDVAIGLANAINSDANLSVLKLVASAGSTSLIQLYSNSSNTTYSESTSVGATEIISLSSAAGLENVFLSGTVGTPQVTFYDFATPSEYARAAGPLEPSNTGPEHVQINQNVNGVTPYDVLTGPYGFVLTFETAKNGVSPQNEYNITAHETGHVLDFIYGKAGILASATTYADVTGTVTPGDVLTLSIQNAQLPGGSASVEYTVQSGDTQSTIAGGLSAAVTNAPALSGIISSMHTTADAQLFSLVDHANALSTYSITGATTETITIGSSNRASDSKLYKNSLAADWKKVKAEYACTYFYPNFPGSDVAGIFTARKDPSGNYFCNANTDASKGPIGDGNGDTLLAPYTGLDNEQVIELAYPSIFQLPAGHQRHEIWAEILPYLNESNTDLGDGTFRDGPNAGSPNLQANEFYLQFLSCSFYLEYSLFNTGTPTPGGGCPKK